MSGVEFAGELHDFLYQDVRRLYPQIYPDIRVRLVEGREVERDEQRSWSAPHAHTQRRRAHARHKGALVDTYSVLTGARSRPTPLCRIRMRISVALPACAAANVSLTVMCCLSPPWSQILSSFDATLRDWARSRLHSEVREFGDRSAHVAVLCHLSLHCTALRCDR